MAGDGKAAPADGSAKAGPYHSLMFEVCESHYRKVNQEQVQLGGTAGTWSQVRIRVACKT